MMIRTLSRQGQSIAACLLVMITIVCAGIAAAAQALFSSHRVTAPGEFTFRIEGPAVDALGNLYVVNFQRDGTIGKLTPGASHPQLLAALPPGSIGNGIRFDRDGRMFIADFKQHNIFVIERGQNAPQIYFHSSGFNQPNDLAVATDGTLYASDPKFSTRSGQIWRITRGADGKGHGEVMTSTRPHMGVTNGIDLSPDGATLYVSESDSQEVWAYRLDGNNLLEPRMVIRFDGPEVDGLRTDISGRIFVARPSKGQIAIVAADGTQAPPVSLLGKQPTNLTFGGPDGKTVFVTQKDGKFIEAFQTDRPGREPCLQVPGTC
jgi:sugar lactone lactonase YvrE